MGAAWEEEGLGKIFYNGTKELAEWKPIRVGEDSPVGWSLPAPDRDPRIHSICILWKQK